MQTYFVFFYKSQKILFNQILKLKVIIPFFEGFDLLFFLYIFFSSLILKNTEFWNINLYFYCITVLFCSFLCNFWIFCYLNIFRILPTRLYIAVAGSPRSSRTVTAAMPSITRRLATTLALWLSRNLLKSLTPLAETNLQKYQENPHNFFQLTKSHLKLTALNFICFTDPLRTNGYYNFNKY